MLGAAVALAGMLALARLSNLAWEAPGGDLALLRLSWRVPTPATRQCRPPTPAELEGVLPHMRPTEVCVEHTYALRLTTLLDNDTMEAAVIGQGGAHARTITVYRSYPVPPGAYRIQVSLRPDVSPAGPPTNEAMDALDMTVADNVAMSPGQVVLVTRGVSGQLEIAGDP